MNHLQKYELVKFLKEAHDEQSGGRWGDQEGNPYSGTGGYSSDFSDFNNFREIPNYKDPTWAENDPWTQYGYDKDPNQHKSKGVGGSSSYAPGMKPDYTMGPTPPNSSPDWARPETPESDYTSLTPQVKPFTGPKTMEMEAKDWGFNKGTGSFTSSLPKSRRPGTPGGFYEA